MNGETKVKLLELLTMWEVIRLGKEWKIRCLMNLR